MSTRRLIVTIGLTAAVLFGVPSAPLQGQVCVFPANSLPPLDGCYIKIKKTLFFNVPGFGLVRLRDIIHDRFTSSNPPPPPVRGSTTTHTFGSFVRGIVVLPDGTTSPIDAPAQSTVEVTSAGQENNTQRFETEMLQLDISGGNLPPGFMIRVSPTQRSFGGTSIKDLSNGTFEIKSFFNIFTELSTNGGQTWIPSTNRDGTRIVAVKVELRCCP
jgi:hypothetical protein